MSWPRLRYATVLVALALWLAALLASGAVAIAAFTTLPDLELATPTTSRFFGDDTEAAGRYLAGFVTNPVFLASDRVRAAAAMLVVLAFLLGRGRVFDHHGRCVRRFAQLALLLAIGLCAFERSRWPPICKGAARELRTPSPMGTCNAMVWKEFYVLHRTASTLLRIELLAVLAGLLLSAFAGPGRRRRDRGIMMDPPPVGGPRASGRSTCPRRPTPTSVGRRRSSLRRRHPDARCSSTRRRPTSFSSRPSCPPRRPTWGQQGDARPVRRVPHSAGLRRGHAPGHRTSRADGQLLAEQGQERPRHDDRRRRAWRRGPPRDGGVLALPGVARKTANVVLGNAFGINHGVVVDTHVGRLSRRFGLVPADEEDPVRIERRLMSLFPRPSWCLLSHLMIFHGRRVCKARGGGCADDRLCRRWCTEGGG